MSRWATDRFRNLPDEKRGRILLAAVREFATHGYTAANTNRIAQDCGISVGALFKYFATKQDLFRHVIAAGADLIEERVGSLLSAPGDTMTKIERLVRLTVSSSREQREFIRLYHEITGTGTQELVHDTARALETWTSRAYVSLLREGQSRGEIRSDIDAETLAFCVDNLLMVLQFSYACDYFTDRAGLYLGPDFTERDDDVVEQVLAFVHSAVRATPSLTTPPLNLA